MQSCCVYFVPGAGWMYVRSKLRGMFDNFQCMENEKLLDRVMYFLWQNVHCNIATKD